MSSAGVDPLLVAIVADDESIRSGLRDLVEGDASLKLVGVAADATSGRALLRHRAIDVLAVSFALQPYVGRPDGIQFIRSARRRREDIGILCLKRDTERSFVRDAIDAGADACCLVDAPAKAILRAIKATTVGAVWLDADLSRTIFRSNEADVPIPRVTVRERLILHYITKGYTNAEMALALNCKSGTIHTHVMNLYEKLGVHDRASAVVSGLRLGLLS